jgi:phosphoserine phosphatase RsbU/P
LPLGIERDRGYDCPALTLEPGDLLVLYTDGVVEAENLQREEYGEERLRDVLRLAGGVAPQGDDLTCFVLRYRGKT